MLEVKPKKAENKNNWYRQGTVLQITTTLKHTSTFLLIHTENWTWGLMNARPGLYRWAGSPTPTWHSPKLISWVRDESFHSYCFFQGVCTVCIHMSPRPTAGHTGDRNPAWVSYLQHGVSGQQAWVAEFVSKCLYPLSYLASPSLNILKTVLPLYLLRHSLLFFFLLG